MGRPRNRTIKLVLDVSEDTYQTIAVEAHKAGLTVTGLVESLLPKPYAAVPLFEGPAPSPAPEESSPKRKRG